jgi:hypothetical protein
MAVKVLMLCLPAEDVLRLPAEGVLRCVQLFTRRLPACLHCGLAGLLHPAGAISSFAPLNR